MGRPPKIHSAGKKDKPSKQRRAERRKGLKSQGLSVTVTQISPEKAVEVLFPSDALPIDEAVAIAMRAAGVSDADIRYAIEEGARWSPERQSLSFPPEIELLD